jgi:hypothetical protein
MSKASDVKAGYVLLGIDFGRDGSEFGRLGLIASAFSVFSTSGTVANELRHH